MPELPDLEVMSRNLDKKLVGHKLKAISVKVAKKLNVTAVELEKALIGHALKKVYREGKELRFTFAGEAILGLHLMLHGEVKIVEEASAVKFPILELHFSNSLKLVLSDFQKQATPTLDPTESEVPDAIDAKVNEEFFIELLKKKKSAVKNVLLDQHLIRGIGNAYADEIFYEAGISPFSISNKIPEKAIKKLSSSVRKVLTNAIDKISTVDPDRITGENRDFMKVHLPKKDKTATGEEILIEKHGARKTYYVKSQILYQ